MEHFGKDMETLAYRFQEQLVICYFEIYAI